MSWGRTQSGYRQLTVRTRDSASIIQGILEFWRRFAEDTIPEVNSSAWDYLLIDVRGIDERFGVYPQRLNSPPFKVSWASLSILQMGYDYREIADSNDGESKAR